MGSFLKLHRTTGLWAFIFPIPGIYQLWELSLSTCDKVNTVAIPDKPDSPHPGIAIGQFVGILQIGLRPILIHKRVIIAIYNCFFPFLNIIKAKAITTISYINRIMCPSTVEAEYRKLNNPLFVPSNPKVCNRRFPVIWSVTAVQIDAV